jgi:phenylacetate-coenzyme A ligase PaaK-like adenylate-forming protein
VGKSIAFAHRLVEERDMTTTDVNTDPMAPEALQRQAAELLERDRWPRERLDELTDGRLRRLLDYVVETSPYYREVLGPGASEVDLATLPTLPKSILMEHFDEIVTDPRLRRGEIEEFLGAADAGELFHDEYRVFSTSGTSGLSGLFVYSQAEFAHWAAVFLRSFARLGLEPETRLTGIGAPSPLHLSRQVAAALMAGRGGPRLAVTMPIADIVGALNEYLPEFLVSYPTILALLAEEQLNGNLDIAPRVLVSVSEVLTEDAARRIEQAWAKPVEMYASTEVGVIAVGSLSRTGMHVCEEAIVEVVDENDQAVRPGMPGAKVLLTNLVNRAQPLIRYELNDSVVMADGPGPDGLPYERIERVDGRSDDVLELPSSQTGMVKVHPYLLRAPFARLPEVVQYQIVHREDSLLVRVVPRRDAPGDLVEVVTKSMRKAVSAAGATIPVEVVVVGNIEREPGHAAKVKLVLSEVPVGR